MTTTLSGQLALDTAERLLPIDNVLTGLAAQDRGSLAGLAGTALLHARLATVDDKFAQAAHNHWNHAASHARRSLAGRRPAGTFTGPGALAASLILGSPYLPDPDQQHEATARAARWLSARACSVADQHCDRLQSGALTTPWTVYDTINGLAGIGRVLLAAVTLGHTDARKGLFAALSTLTTMIGIPGQSRPGWWLPADQHPSATPIHSSGAATTGLAHGIAGPLSLLAAAQSAGHSVPGQSQAIRHAARWLLHWQGPARTWPPHVTGNELDQDTAAPAPGRRDAWCYGTPGISRALTLAAQALAEEEFRLAARQASPPGSPKPGMWKDPPCATATPESSKAPPTTRPWPNKPRQQSPPPSTPTTVTDSSTSTGTPPPTTPAS